MASRTASNRQPLPVLIEHLKTRNFPSPFYLYDGDGARAALQDLVQLLKDRLKGFRAHVYLPVFANPCLPLLDLLVASADRVGVLVNTVPELAAVQSYSWQLPPQIAFAGGILSAGEVKRVCHGANLFYAASISNFETALECDARPVADLGLRIDLSETGELRGVPIRELKEYFSKHADRAQKVSAIHAYQGPNVPSFDACLAHADALLSLVDLFPALTQVNFSGGWPFDYSETDAPLPSTRPSFLNYLAELEKLIRQFCKRKSIVEMAFEPGKFLLAAYGFFFCSVVESRPTGTHQTDVHLDSSFVHLPSLKLKDRQHAVALFDSAWQRRATGRMFCRLRGCTGLSTDFLMPRLVVLPAVPKPGDHIVIHDLGVYGWAGSYNFLGLQRPAEYVMCDGQIHLVREQQGENHLLEGLRPLHASGDDITSVAQPETPTAAAL